MKKIFSILVICDETAFEKISTKARLVRFAKEVAHKSQRIRFFGRLNTLAFFVQLPSIHLQN